MLPGLKLQRPMSWSRRKMLNFFQPNPPPRFTMSQHIKRAEDAAAAGVAEADMEVELSGSNNVDGVTAENMTNETGPLHDRETSHVDIAAKEGMTERSAQPKTRSVSNVKGQDILATCVEAQQPPMLKTRPHRNRNLEQTPELAA